MHDPMIVAHEIKYPWFNHKPWPKKRRRDPNPFTLRRHWKEMTDAERAGRSQSWPDGYRDTFITIWHVDPEKDGTDDSCGWAWPKITKKQREVLRNVAWNEGDNPHFLCCAANEWEGTITEAISLKLGLYLLVDRVLKLHLDLNSLHRAAIESEHIHDCGKSGAAFCFLPGYHTNSENDSKEGRQEHFHGILCNVARHLLDMKRPWWRHPKWHFWHWKISCQPVSQFKRWAFSRCCKCGKRFAWGYSPVTNNWNSHGPRWFRGETDVFHSSCDRPDDPCVAEVSTN